MKKALLPLLVIISILSFKQVIADDECKECQEQAVKKSLDQGGGKEAIKIAEKAIDKDCNKLAIEAAERVCNLSKTSKFFESSTAFSCNGKDIVGDVTIFKDKKLMSATSLLSKYNRHHLPEMSPATKLEAYLQEDGKCSSSKLQTRDLFDEIRNIGIVPSNSGWINDYCWYSVVYENPKSIHLNRVFVKNCSKVAGKNVYSAVFFSADGINENVKINPGKQGEGEFYGADGKINDELVGL